MKIVFPVVLALLFVGIICATSSAQPDDKDAGGSLPGGTTPDLPKPSACPSDMVEIEGAYCPRVKETCLYNVDGNGKRSTKPVDDLWSCGEFDKTVVCLSKPNEIKHLHFCMDKYEWPNKEGQIPQDWVSWYDAKSSCESVGKRLSTAHEWTLAAEGSHMHPLPYGDGFHRDNTMCNFDRYYSSVTGTQAFKDLGLKTIDVFQSRSSNDKMSQALRLFLVPSGSMPNCMSDYGVYDMAGNIDEWVLNEGGITSCPSAKCDGWISGLKGGHVWHVRNASRPMTGAHGPTFGWYETGTRCAKDIQ